MLRPLVPILVMLACVPALAQDSDWVGSWGASPLAPRAAAAGPFPASPSFDNVTVRQIVRLSAGGERLRLRLTNEYGAAPLAIGAARVAIVDDGGALRRRSERVVTFSGATSTLIPTGAPLLSDPIDLAVDDLGTIAVSLYFPEDTGPCTCHQVGLENAFVSAPGDHTSGDFEPAGTIQERAFLSGVEVDGAAAGAIVALGDSITDGVGSTGGANRRWPDVLAERLAARRGPMLGIVNHGISGNRVLSDGAGVSALARFDRDVLSVPGVTHVIVFEGVNDLGLGLGSLGGGGAALFGGAGMPVTEATLIAGYRQLIARARSKGLEIYGATIAPYAGAGYFSEEGEAVRRAVNDWIRTSGEFDAVLDFDAVLRDPDDPSRMAEGLHSGDFLHGSDAGYEALADSIDLALF